MAAEKIGRLEFEGTPIDLNDYKDFLKEYLPKGKDNTVAFKMMSYRPYKALGAQKPFQQATAERQLATFDTVSFPVKNEDGDLEYKEGVLQYFETKKSRRLRDATVTDYGPTLITFVAGVMVFSSKNLAKILYLLCHSENNRNKLQVINDKEEGWSQKQPLFEMVLQSAKNKKVTASIGDKNKAFTLVNDLKKSNPDKLRKIHEACGFSDWDLHVNKKMEGDWDAILAPLYNLTDSDPQRIISLNKDSSLNLQAIVTQAIEGAFVVYENNKFLWGPKANGGKFIDKEPKDKTIASPPPGKQQKDTSRSWFIDFLGDNPDVLLEINRDLELQKSKTE